MKFGSVTDPSSIDFSLPRTPSATLELLKANPSDEPFAVYVGCAKWNKTDLKGFYPRGTKDELAYYATKFNAIELNATFYNSPSKDQVKTWKDKTDAEFKFFPKIPQSISHFNRLLNTKEKVETFVDATVLFEEKLGMGFLQMHEHFKPKDMDRLEQFLTNFPAAYPLAIEVRNEAWFADKEVAEHYFALLEKTNKTNIIVDTAGRRDLLHLRLTTPIAFVRFVGANAPSDYTRLEDWVSRISEWRAAGLQKLYFFIHQNMEKESPLLANHFITLLNKSLGLNLKLPNSDKLF